MTQDEQNKAIGARLRELRKAAGLGQAAVAEKWECSPSNVSRAEAGEQSLSASQLIAFAALVGVSVEDIVAPASAPVASTGDEAA